MRYLWITSLGMIACSLALIAGKLMGFLDPIALVCGVLLLWSGIVKIIVLRIWHTAFKAPIPSDTASRAARPARILRRLS